MMRSLLLSCICVLILINTGITSTPKFSQNLLKNKEWGFLPNLGQLADERGNALPDVKYYGHQGGVYLYCRPHKISFVFTKIETEQGNVSEATAEPALPGAFKKRNPPKNTEINTTRADMMLMGANPNAQIIATEEQAYFENYYLPQTTIQGITNVHTYNTIIYQNIYPNIDLVLHSKAMGIKYEFVVHPGGKVSDIQMQWYGLASAQLMAGGGISYSMRLDKNKIGMQESAPLSFTEQGKVASNFIKHGNRIAFKTGYYDHNKTLTIDPDINWSTYYGGEADDFPGKICTDASDNIILSGYTLSKTGIASSGVYQSTLHGNKDIFIAKFDKSGKLLWSTYYGGKGDDYMYGLSIDPNGNIYVGGNSNSDSLATPSAYQAHLAGDTDALIAKFSPSGSMVWATYFGGKSYDELWGMCIDNNGYVYISGSTQSTTGIASSGAYKSTASQNEYAFLAKFNNDGNIDWATYFGTGNTNCYSTAVNTDNMGNVVMVGTTYAYFQDSSTFYGLATSGAYQTSNGGRVDIFISKFSGKGSLLWATYMGGKQDDDANSVNIDKSGNIYVCGSTNSEGLGTSGVYQSTWPKTICTYLSKFSAAGSMTWFTYYGDSTGRAWPADMFLDNNENIYITGATSNTTGLATAGSFQTKNASNGGYNAFIGIFSNKGILNWATFYGGTITDAGYSICCDTHGDILVTGYSCSPGLASSGAYQTSLSSIYDCFILKLTPYKSSSGIAIDQTDHRNIAIYPNPFSDKTIIHFNNQQAAMVKVSVSDMLGKVLYTSANKQYTAGDNEIEINSAEAGLSTGSYFVSIMIGTETVVKKVVLMR